MQLKVIRETPQQASAAPKKMPLKNENAPRRENRNNMHAKTTQTYNFLIISFFFLFSASEFSDN